MKSVQVQSLFLRAKKYHYWLMYLRSSHQLDTNNEIHSLIYRARLLEFRFLGKAPSRKTHNPKPHVSSAQA